VSAVYDGGALDITLTATTVGAGGNDIVVSHVPVGDSWFGDLPRHLAGGAEAEEHNTLPGQAGGTMQCGHIAVLTHGEGVDATVANQVVQLPNIPCRKVVIGFPTEVAVTAAFGDTYAGGNANNSGRLLFCGDAAEQAFALEAGQAEEFEVSNANQIYLRDVGLSWEDFNGDGHLSNYFIVAVWRVIK
jgi:hypothetical protein